MKTGALKKSLLLIAFAAIVVTSSCGFEFTVDNIPSGTPAPDLGIPESYTADKDSLAPQLPALPNLEETIGRARSSVVRIDTVSPDFLGFGSGVVFQTEVADRNTLILTNYHVVEDAQSITVQVNDEIEYDGTVVGFDARRDLAVVSICCDVEVQPLSFGDSDSLRSGAEVIAMGYALGLEGEVTVTRGIVSAQRYQDDIDVQYIQTDAPINEGNSGGPLLNLQGHIIGINSRKINLPGVEGFGFAISEETISKSLPLFIDTKIVMAASVPSASLGIPPTAPAAPLPNPSAGDSFPTPTPTRTAPPTVENITATPTKTGVPTPTRTGVPIPTSTATPTHVPTATSTDVPTATPTTIPLPVAPHPVCESVSEGSFELFAGACNVVRRLDFPGEVHQYTFEVNKGDLVIATLIRDENLLDSRIELYNPAGHFMVDQGIVYRTTAGTIEWRADNSGTYSLRVVDLNNAIGTYTLSFNHLPVGGGLQLSGNANYQAEIKQNGQVHWYSFQANQGDQVVVVIGETDEDQFVRPQIYDPQGSILWVEYSNRAKQIRTISGPIPEDGNYVIKVYDWDMKTGIYTFSFNKFAAGGSSSPTATPTNVPPSPTPTLAPTKVPTAIPSATPVVMPTPKIVSGPNLQYGDTVVGDISPAGDIDLFRFEGKAGQVPYIAVHLAVKGCQAEIELENPSGEIVAQGRSRNCYSVFLSHKLTSDGQFKFRVSQSGLGTASYTLALYDLAAGAATSIGYGDHIGAELKPIGKVDAYSFDGDEGDEVVLVTALDEGSCYLIVEIYDPLGSTLVSERQCTFVRINKVLSATGTYTIVVRHDLTGPPVKVHGYTLTLKNLSEDSPDSPAPVPNYDLTIKVKPQAAADAGAVVNGSGVYASGTDVRVSAKSETSCVSNGRYVFQQFSNVDTDIMSNPGNVTMNSDRIVTAVYVFRDFEDCIPDPTPGHASTPTPTPSARTCMSIKIGEPVSESISPSLDVDCYTFPWTGKGTVFFRMAIPPSGPYIQPSMEVLDPEGKHLPADSRVSIESVSRWGEGCSGFTSISTFLQFKCELQTSGTHTIFVSDLGGDDTGSYDLWIQRDDNPVGCTPIDYDEPTTGTIGLSVEMGCHTFSATDGNRVRLRFFSSSITPSWGLSRIGSETGSPTCSGGRSQLDCDIHSTGTHAIRIAVLRNGQAGNYEISLICLSSGCGDSDQATPTPTATPTMTPTPSPTPTFPTCQVSGFITSDTTWTNDCDYIVSGSLIVQTEVTLTIEPGVNVLFNNKIGLEIQGGLVARGTENEKITFTSNPADPLNAGARGDWANIILKDSSINAELDGNGNYLSGSVIEHAVIEHAGSSGSAVVDIQQAAPYIANNSIRNNSISAIRATIPEGLRIRILDNDIRNNLASMIWIIGNRFGGMLLTGSGEVIGNVVSNNQGGIAVSGGFTVADNLVESNSGIGISASPILRISGANSQILDNVVSDNSGIGVFTGGVVLVERNEIQRNGGPGIRLYWDGYGPAEVRDNTITDNLGGGVSIIGAAITVTITGNRIERNVAANGGGINASGQSAITVTGNIISNNRATSVRGGGGIWIKSVVVANDNDIFGNTSGSDGSVPNDVATARGAGSPDIDFKNNWWGTIDESEIEELVWHRIDNFALAIVDYTPFASGPVAGD